MVDYLNISDAQAGVALLENTLRTRFERLNALVADLNRPTAGFDTTMSILQRANGSPELKLAFEGTDLDKTTASLGRLSAAAGAITTTLDGINRVIATMEDPQSGGQHVLDISTGLLSGKAGAVAGTLLFGAVVGAGVPALAGIGVAVAGGVVAAYVVDQGLDLIADHFDVANGITNVTEDLGVFAGWSIERSREGVKWLEDGLQELSSDKVLATTRDLGQRFVDGDLDISDMVALFSSKIVALGLAQFALSTYFGNIHMSTADAKAFHYGRNARLTEGDPDLGDLLEQGWTVLSAAKSKLHQIDLGADTGNSDNLKLVSPDGLQEYVFDQRSGQFTNDASYGLVTSDLNVGTFNFFGPTESRNHFLADVVPWLLWGNSAIDEDRDGWGYAERVSSFFRDGSAAQFVESFSQSIDEILNDIRWFFTFQASDIELGTGNDVHTETASANSINLGDGFDTLSYYNSSAGVVLNLYAGEGYAGDAYGDVYVFGGQSIEKVEGSNHADVIIGNNYDNHIVGFNGADDLRGLMGQDTLDGNSGQDILKGGRGDDLLRGGLGNDTAVYDGRSWEYTVTQIDADLYTVESLATNEGTDTLRSIEFIQFGSSVYGIAEIPEPPTTVPVEPDPSPEPDPITPDPDPVPEPGPPPYLVVGDIEVAEGTGANANALVFTVSAIGNRTDDIVFSVSPAPDADSGGGDILPATQSQYTIYESGAASVQVIVPIIADSRPERTDTVALSLTPISGTLDLGRSDLNAIGTIFDDDSLRIGMNTNVGPSNAQSTTTTEVYSFITSGSGQFSVDVRDATADVEVKILDNQGAFSNPSLYDYALAGNPLRIAENYTNNQLYFVEVTSNDPTADYNLRVSNPATSPISTGDSYVDLAVTDVRFGGASIQRGSNLGQSFAPGETVFLDYSVSNLGNAQIGISSSMVLGGTGTNGIYAPNLVSVLEAGATDVTTGGSFIIPDNAESGTFEIGVIADAYEQVDEGGREGNNRFAFNITIDTGEGELPVAADPTVPVGGGDPVTPEPVEPVDDPGVPVQSGPPDIAIRDFEFVTAYNLAGEYFYASYEIINLGETRSQREDATLYLSLDNVLDASDIELGTEQFSRLSQDNTDSETQTGTLPSNMGPGTYHLLLVADAVEGEINTANNIASATFVIDQVPDLAITRASLDFTTAQQEGLPRVDYQVTNIGGAATSNVQFGFYLSATPDFSDAVLIGDTQFTLAPQESYTRDNRLLSMLDGHLDPSLDQYLFLYANHFQTGTETSFDNNLSKGLRLNEAFRAPADLVIQDLSLSTTALDPQARPEVSLTVQNIGERFVDYDYVQFFAANINDADDLISLGSFPFFELSAGEIKTRSWTFSQSWYDKLDTTQTYDFFAVTNVDGRTEESNTNNNTSEVLRLSLPNEAPIQNLPLESVAIDAGSGIDIMLPPTLFVDPDGDAISVTVSSADNRPLPDWFQFDHVSGRISGTVPPDSRGFIEVRVTASDGGLETSETFTVNITPLPIVFVDRTLENPTLEFDFSGSMVSQTVIGDSSDNNMHGGLRDDLLRGMGGDDLINGHNGNDTLIGGAGADDLNGGSGVDLASYADASGRVNLDLRSRGTAGEATNDMFSSIENVRGSDFGDYVYGDNANNVIDGGAGDDRLRGHNGNDTLIGGAGADDLNGGSGVDLASYVNASERVNLDLRSRGTAGEATNDTFSSIENVLGSDFGDYVYGDNANNVIDGGAGDDRLRGHNGNDTLIGGAGADDLNGGSGVDLVSYADASERVNLDLRSRGTAGEATNDTFSSIENVRGSDFGDYVYGDSANNVINGGDGDDRLRGHNGNDTLIGGAGADDLNGGSGVDLASYADASGRVNLDLRSRGTAGEATNDTFSSIENVRGSDFGDYVYGDDANNVIDGGAGDDRLRGHNGNDTLIGGAGADDLNGGSGADVFHFAIGHGADVITDFQNDIDTIEFADFAFASVQGALDFAAQTGSDVVFDFGNGDYLTVEDTMLGQLINDLEII